MLDFALNIHRDLSRNDLLIAEPFLADQNFDRSVILICDYRDKGAFGLILNRPTGTMLSEVLDWPGRDFPVFSGGPVEPNALYFVHEFPEIEHALPLRDGFYLSGSFEQLQELAARGRVWPGSCRFFAGYSGWGAQQLDGEIAQDAWIISKSSLREALALPAEQMWRGVLRNMGGRYRMFSNYPSDPTLN
ncbi:MAG: YqgE/AlgH family protein [Bernardetiaceae bacterium]